MMLVIIARWNLYPQQSSTHCLKENVENSHENIIFFSENLEI